MDSELVFSNGQRAQDVAPTPNLDRLADEGVVFERAYSTSSICVPSLQTLLSARGDHWREWEALRGEIRSRIEFSELEQAERRENRNYETLPRALGRLGYRTWAGGKLWAGTFEDAGFSAGTGDAVLGPPYHQSSGSMFGRAGWSPDACGSTALPGASCPALDPLRGFLDEAGGEPFFLWVAPTLPHTPYNAAPEYREPFVQSGMNEEEIRHLANIRWFDEFTGELVGELAARGILEETLIIYLVDNGWGIGFQARPGEGKGKGTLYDLGYRTPLVFSLPGQVPSGERYSDLVSLADIPATIMEYAGGKALDGTRGSSLKERVSGGPSNGRTEVFLKDRYAGSAIVTDHWRYLMPQGRPEELYRIDLDPFEDVNLAAEFPQELELFRARAVAYWLELLSPRVHREITGWLKDPSGEPISGAILTLEAGRYRPRAMTGTGGWFRFTGIPDMEEIEVRAGSGVRRLELDGIEGDPVALPLRGAVTPLVGVPRRNVGGVVGGSIAGEVRSTSGEVIPGAEVRGVGRADGQRVVVRTYADASGRYSLDKLPVGIGYRMVVRSRGFRTSKLSSPEVTGPLDEQTLDIVLESR